MIIDNIYNRVSRFYYPSYLWSWFLSIYLSAGIGKCPFLVILNMTFMYLWVIISPVVGWCSIRTFTNPCSVHMIISIFPWFFTISPGDLPPLPRASKVRHPAGWCHATGPWPAPGTVKGEFFHGDMSHLLLGRNCNESYIMGRYV